MTIRTIAIAAMALAGFGAIAMSASAQDSQGFAGDAVSIENFIGRIELRTGGSQIQVEIRNPGDAAEDPVATATAAAWRSMAVRACAISIAAPITVKCAWAASCRPVRSTNIRSW